MMIAADKFILDFPDALDIIVFDEKDSEKPSFHGLSHAMKTAELIMDMANGFYEYPLKITNRLSF